MLHDACAAPLAAALRAAPLRQTLRRLELSGRWCTEISPWAPRAARACRAARGGIKRERERIGWKMGEPDKMVFRWSNKGEGELKGCWIPQGFLRLCCKEGLLVKDICCLRRGKSVLCWRGGLKRVWMGFAGWR